MVRATRLRKLHSKYPEGDYKLSASPKKSPVKKMETETLSAVSKGSKSGLTKGNLNTGWRTLTGTRTAILRDRTNLKEEPLKVDLLIKQGTGRGIAKKVTKSTRNLRSKTSEENNGEEVERTSSVDRTKKRRKLENGKESTPDEDLKIRKEIQSDDEETDKTVLAPKRGTKLVKKSIQSSKPRKINAEIAKKSGRKRAREVDNGEDESASENTDEKAKSPDSEGQTTGLANKRSKNQVVAKVTRKTTVKSTASRENDNKELVKSDFSKSSRKGTRKVVTERESSVDSGLDPREVSENDENQESEINTKLVETTKKSVRRLTSRKVTISKKSEINVVSANKTSRQLTIGKVSEQEAKASKDLIGGKKFFKNKVEKVTVEKKLSPMKKTVTGKRRNIGNPRLSVSFHPRQTTLQESFAKQKSRKLLRPRTAKKDYCEETLVDKKDVAKTGDGVEAAKRTGPVYKSIKPDEDSVKDKNAIYDFKWDRNDSQEKLPKKKRTRNPRKNVATKKMVGPKKTTNSKKTTGQTGIKNMDVVEQVSTEPQKPMDKRQIEMNNFHEEINDPPENEGAIEPPQNLDQSPVVQKGKPKVIESVELRGNECLTLTTTPVLAKLSEPKKRSNLQASKQFRKMLGHALLNKSISPITKAIENFDPGSPWRPPVFSIQEFSRVKNVVQSTPQVQSFKAILENATAKTANACNTENKNDKIITEKIDDAKISKISGQRLPNKVIDIAESPRKFGTVISNLNNEPIANARRLESNTTNSKDSDSTPQKIVVYATIETPPTGSAPVKSRPSDDFSEPMNFGNEDVSDKENSLPVVPSPKRSPLKSLNRTPLGNLNNSLSTNLNTSPSKNLSRSPLKNFNRSPMKNLDRSPLKNLDRSPLKNLDRSPLKNLDRSPLKNLDRSPLKNLNRSPLRDPKKILAMLRAKKQQNENTEPQAGPSNQKMVESHEDSRILRQSNLDNYLNLDEMPKSTRIMTPHGIFDDAHSTPIIGKPTKRMSKAGSVENAFGFDVSDEDSEKEIAPIKKFIPDNPIVQRGLTQAQQQIKEKTITPTPARLSVGDIKKHLFPLRKKEKVNKAVPVIERIEEEDDEKQESHSNKNERENARVQKIIDPIDFSDTFDVSENREAHDESTMEVELFADLEPQHFKQAPRYSYKRKRAAGFVISDGDEDSENVEPARNFEPKRRKIGKAERERRKEMENWAKDLNQTFEEIEHFDLVVE